MGMLPKDLPKKEKLKYVLKLIEQGYDRKYISENMGYSRTDSLDRFMKNYGYTTDRQTNKYILPIEDTCPTINLQNQQKLLDIIDNHNKIMDIIKWFDTKEDSCPTEVIEVVNGLQINYNKSETVKTTVRVDKDIWNEFSNLCIDKYSQFSKIDILSQILDDFIKKYKQD